MAVLLRQSTSVVIPFGPFLLFSDGVSLVTNLVGTGANQTENTSTGIRIAKNGGAFAARHATATASTYDAFGNYLVTLDTTDTGSLGVLRVQFANGAAFCPVWQDFMVINSALYDALCASSGGAIPNSVAGASGGIPTLDAALTVSANVVQSGTAQGGGAATITLAAGASATDNLYNGSVLTIFSGTGAGQSRTIIGYVGSTKVATLGRNWVTNPDNTSVYKVHGLAVPRVDDNLAVILQTGTGTGQLDFTSGVVKANLAQILGTALTETAGLLAGGFKKFFNIASPTLTIGGVDQTGDSFAVVKSGGAGDNAAIKAKTDNLPALPASTTNITAATGITVTTNNDKTGYSLTQAFPANFSALVIDGTGRVNAFLIGILTSVFTEGAAGRIAAAFKQFFNIATPTATMDHGVLVDTATTLTNAPVDSSGTTTLLSRLSAARAGYLDALNGIVAAIWAAVVDSSGVTTLLSRLTSGRATGLDNLDATISSRTKPADTQARVALVDTVTTNTDMRGTDGAALASNWTATRAGYVDNLNIGGAVASHADILALNQSASKHLLIQTVGQYERPESGNTTYTVEVRTFSASTGAAVNADSTPTIAPVGSISGDLSANLGAVSNPATGVYRATYTVANNATQEQIRFDASATIASTTFTLSCYTQVVDDVSATWTSTDASHLTSVFNKLPANAIADETLLAAALAAIPTTPLLTSDSRLNHLDADISTRTKPADTQAAVTLVATTTNVTNAPTNGDLTATMKASVTTAASAATPAVTVSDKTGFSLSTAGILAIWHQLTSAIVTAGTIGKLIVDNLNAAMTSRAVAGDAMTLTSGERTSIGTAVWASTTRTLSGFGTLVADIATAVWAGGTRTLTAFGFTVNTVANATETAIKVVTDALSTALELSNSVYRFTVAALFNAPSGGGGAGGLDAAGVRAAIGMDAADLDAQLLRIDNKTSLITVDNITVSSPVSKVGNKITIQRGSTIVIPITGLGSLVGRSKLYFTVKAALADADEQAVIQIEETGGLIRPAGAPGNGSLTVDNEVLGNVTVRIEAAASSLLETTLNRQSRGINDASLYYDIKRITAGAVESPVHGRFVVEGEVTQATT